MKNLMITIITITILLLACDKPNDRKVRIEPPEKLVSYFTPQEAQEGSYYVFQEQNSGDIDTLWLTRNDLVGIICYGEDTAYASYKCNYESNQSDNLEFNMHLTTQCSSKNVSIQVRYPISNLSFDYSLEGDSFSINGHPFGKFLSEYSLSGEMTFNDVFIADQQGATSLSYDYVWAKGIGVIHIFIGQGGIPYGGSENWKLIDYNLKP